VERCLVKSAVQQVDEWLAEADSDQLRALISHLTEGSIEAAVLAYQFIRSN
jgi:hypothetical protein